MKREENNLLLGILEGEGLTKTYTATSNWKEVSSLWQIKMYPVYPGSGEPVEQKTICKDSEALLPIEGRALMQLGAG